MAITEFRRTKANAGLMIYPSDLLSKREFRTSGAEERALMFSITLECWVNGSVPSDPEQLSKIVALPLNVVRMGLTKNVVHFLDEHNGEFTMPDVERYREEVEERRRKQSQGGKKGMKTRWADSAEPSDNSVIKEHTNQDNKMGITPRDRVRVRGESDTESLGNGGRDSFVEEMERYERESNGL
jgi:hypothetical protein